MQSGILLTLRLTKSLVWQVIEADWTGKAKFGEMRAFVSAK